MMDTAFLERVLDLWASKWHAEERAKVEVALERVADGDGPLPRTAAAVAACAIISTPRLLRVVERARWVLDDATLAQIDAVAKPRARIQRLAEKLDRASVTALVEKVVSDARNPVANMLLDRVDIRELYAVMNLTFDREQRVEAARRIARRGEHQRARLVAALDLSPAAFDALLAVDAPIDDLDDGTGEGAYLSYEIEQSVSAA
jgi:hypothetical protein